MEFEEWHSRIPLLANVDFEWLINCVVGVEDKEIVLPLDEDKELDIPLDEDKALVIPLDIVDCTVIDCGKLEEGTQ